MKHKPPNIRNAKTVRLQGFKNRSLEATHRATEQARTLHRNRVEAFGYRFFGRRLTRATGANSDQVRQTSVGA